MIEAGTTMNGNSFLHPHRKVSLFYTSDHFAISIVRIVFILLLDPAKCFSWVTPRKFCSDTGRIQPSAHPVLWSYDISIRQ